MIGLYGAGVLVAFVTGLMSGAMLLRLLQLRAAERVRPNRTTEPPMESCRRVQFGDALTETWCETEQRLAPDHGYGPDPRGPGMCRWEVRP